jgi:hypothetical protein
MCSAPALASACGACLPRRVSGMGGQDLYRRLELGEITRQGWNERFGALLEISPENPDGAGGVRHVPGYDVMRVAREARAAGGAR